MNNYLKYLSNNIFTIKYKVCSTGEIMEVNPLANNAYFDTLYRCAFNSGEHILLEGELPDKWK